MGHLAQAEARLLLALSQVGQVEEELAQEEAENDHGHERHEQGDCVRMEKAVANVRVGVAFVVVVVVMMLVTMLVRFMAVRGVVVALVQMRRVALVADAA